jgi:DNA-binding transcriptional LysR family regulator
MDIPRLDAWSLHCLTVLINERNVTRAGALLELSQPATSAVLAKLRVLFGDALLVKSSTGMIPTPRALELALQAEQVLAGMRLMTQPTELGFDAYSFKGSVAIAATDIVRLLVLPELIKVLETEAPGLTLKVSNADRTRIHERLERAELDLGLGPKEVSSGRLHFRELWTDKAACLIRAGVVPSSEPLSLERFLQLSHIKLVPSQPSHFDDQLDKTLFVEGKSRKVSVLEPSFLMVPSLLSSSKLVATVPKKFADRVCQDAGFQQYEPPLALGQMSIGIYWHERTHKEPLFRWLRTRICALAGSVT